MENRCFSFKSLFLRRTERRLCVFLDGTARNDQTSNVFLRHPIGKCLPLDHNRYYFIRTAVLLSHRLQKAFTRVQRQRLTFGEVKPKSIANRFVTAMPTQALIKSALSECMFFLMKLLWIFSPFARHTERNASRNQKL